MSKIWKKIGRAIFKPTSRGKAALAVVGIFILAVLATALDYPVYWNKSADWLNSQFDRVKYVDQIDIPHFYDLPFHLGLDLLGGTHLVYEADVSGIPAKERGESIEGVRDVIERRVNTFGVSEPVVQTNKVGDKWRIIVELAGIKDVHEAISMIGETPLLEFKEQNKELRDLTEEEQKQLDEYNSEAKSKAENILAEVRSAGPDADFSEFVKKYSEEDKPQLGLDLPEGVEVEQVNEDYINQTQNPKLFAAAEKAGLNKVVPEVVETGESFNIIKTFDIKEEKKQVLASHILVCYEGATGCEDNISKEDALAKINDLKSQATPENFADLAMQYSTDTGSASTGGDLGWFSRGMVVAEFEDIVFDMGVGEISKPFESQFGYHIIYKRDEQPVKEYLIGKIVIDKQTKADIVGPQDPWKYTGLTGTQLKRAQVQFDPNTNEPQVGLEFNDEGKELFGEITEQNVGKPVAIFLDEQPISVPTVNEPIKNGEAVITGAFSLEEAKTLARRLNAGALPVPIHLISQQTIGASLGEDSVQKSLEAGIIGLILVALFMILFYRIPGVLAVLSLAIYGALVLAIFKLFSVTLTLAGVAGFILSVGMAVDANVLIFERLKEELRLGKSMGSAIEEGFARAWSSIRDGNVSTLITCFILATFTTSIVKGFAITLGIGVLVSMFSAIVITKVFLKITAGWLKSRWWYGVKNNNHQQTENE